MIYITSEGEEERAEETAKQLLVLRREEKIALYLIIHRGKNCGCNSCDRFQSDLQIQRIADFEWQMVMKLPDLNA